MILFYFFYPKKVWGFRNSLYIRGNVLKSPFSHYYCMSASGRIIRGSLTATQSKIILTEGVKVNIVVNGKEQVNQSIVKKPGDICSCTIFRDPIELKQCDIINFISRTTNSKITNAYVSILIELDL